MSIQRTYGEVHGPRIGEMTRRSFMRRMLGVGVGILSLEFLAGTLNFLWPNIREGLGGRLEIGTAADIANQQPEWPSGLPYIFQSRIFVVNVPAAKARVEGNGTVAQPVPDPGTDVSADIPPVDRSVLALYRKCPHLGCQVPQLCDQSQWFECLCHGSKYTVLGEKRDGPAPRGMDRFAVEVEGGVYYVNSAELEDGPPPGTATFDTRAPTDMPHCSA
ncbi:MAG TPA: Rieske 2Fe-2S domain-containing protein [candidate division Zixibacteria bacterium]|nr:Rieske 2Fe-2S domain-containing protein [candidate division Zixibacteria bacterium]